MQRFFVLDYPPSPRMLLFLLDTDNYNWELKNHLCMLGLNTYIISWVPYCYSDKKVSFNYILWEILKTSKIDTATPEAKRWQRRGRSVSFQIWNSQPLCYTKNPSPMPGSRKPSQDSNKCTSVRALGDSSCPLWHHLLVPNWAEMTWFVGTSTSLEGLKCTSDWP